MHYAYMYISISSASKRSVYICKPIGYELVSYNLYVAFCRTFLLYRTALTSISIGNRLIDVHRLSDILYLFSYFFSPEVSSANSYNKRWPDPTSMVGCDSFGEIKEDSLQEIDCPAESTLCEESRPGNKVSSASKILKSRDLVSMATISRAPKAIYKPTLSQIPDTLMTTGTPDDLASKMESSLSGDESRIAAQDLSAVKPSDLSGSQKPTNVQSLSKQLENDDLRRRLQSFIAMKAMEAQGEASNPPQPQPQPVSSPNVLTNTPLQATCTRTDLVDHPVFSNLRQLLTAEKMTATSSKSNTEPPSANLPDLVPLDQQLMSSDGEDSALFGSQQTFTALLSEPLVGHEVTVETDQALGVCRGDELSPLAAPVTSPSLTALPPLAPDLLNQCSPPPEPLTPVASQTTGEIAPDATPSLVQLETADVLANGGVEAPGLVLPGSPPEQTSMSGDQLSPGSAEAWDPSRPAPHQLPPCKVCGVQATGFHYGVNTCEACKVGVETLFLTFCIIACRHNVPQILNIYTIANTCITSC